MMRPSLRRLAAAAAVISAVWAVPLSAADLAEAPADATKPVAAKPAVKKDRPAYERMDYGPFLSASFISWPYQAVRFDNGPGSYNCDSVARGIIVQLDADWSSAIVFDADTMRMAVGWVNGGIKFKGLIGDGDHGWDPTPAAPPLFQTPNGPGWADANGSFTDPREDAIAPLPRPGPLPAEWAKYKGLYRNGRRVVLAYTVGKTPVLESPSLEGSGEAKVIARTIHIEASPQPLAIMLVDGTPQVPTPPDRLTKGVKAEKGGKDRPPSDADLKLAAEVEAAATVAKNPGGAVEGNTARIGNVHVGLVGAPAGAKLEITPEHKLVLRLPALNAPTTLKVLIGGGGDNTRGAFKQVLAASPKKLLDLPTLILGGPSLWTQPVETKGELAKVDPKKPEPYVVDKLTIPYQNPYDSWMRTGAFDFFPDGHRAAITTWSGDVWIVSGIDEKLDHLSWKRFATGLHQPLGLKIVDNTIYVVGHDQITRLHDLNNDGEADFYENFVNDWALTAAFHAFAFDLQTDPQGNFYFAFGSPVHAGGGGFQKITKDHGTLFKVSPDGKKIEHYAEGLRAPNGLGVNPVTGQVTCGDNQGSWVPVDPLIWVKPGMFLGVTPSAHRPMKSNDQHADLSEMPKPLCWMIYPKVDNSCGGQVWVTSDKWGPFKDELLYTSYGQSSLFKVLKDEVNGVVQGGVVRITNKFTSSAMRPRFNPADGQLYVCGLKGWQTNAGKDGGFDRVRYTGAPVTLPTGLHVTKKGIAITFTNPLETAAANDAGSFAVECFNIKWSSAYGTPEVNPYPEKAAAEGGDKKATRAQLDVRSATLSPDGKTVFLEIPDIKPVNCMRISIHVNAADGSPVSCEIGNTIHELAEE